MQHANRGRLLLRTPGPVQFGPCMCSNTLPVFAIVITFTFSTSSREPLDWFWRNFIGMKNSLSLRSVVVFRSDLPRGVSRAGPKLVTGSPSSNNNFFRPEGYSDNRIHSSDPKACRRKRCYFLFHFEFKILTPFDVILDLVILAYFNAMYIDCYAGKSFICINCE